MKWWEGIKVSSRRLEADEKMKLRFLFNNKEHIDKDDDYHFIVDCTVMLQDDAMFSERQISKIRTMYARF